MPKGSAELTNARKEEIIAACRKLYEDMSFKEITLKEIGQQTSFTRTSIYNYFETKEEIFLALLQREYELFVDDLNHLCEEKNSLSGDELASELAHALERRMMMKPLPNEPAEASLFHAGLRSEHPLQNSGLSDACIASFAVFCCQLLSTFQCAVVCKIMHCNVLFPYGIHDSIII